jgi:N-acetylglucosaminyl-diphospho-decaprenol L-rhamnosyltransferase
VAGVAVVIVNFRTPGQVLDCLRSLESELVAEPAPARALVVDNASGDGSLEALRAGVAAAGWPWVRLLATHANRGFAAGNNVALRQLLASPDPPEFLWLLNPDTLVRPGALAALRRCLERRPRVGIVGSQLEHPDGTPQHSAFHFPSAPGEFLGTFRLGALDRLARRWLVAPPPPAPAGPADWVSGASLLVRRAVLDAVGLLDEGYFLYYEEVDFCRRARRAGWHTWHEPASRVVHLVGQSSGVDTGAAERLPPWWFQSRRRYFHKHHGPAGAAVADLAWLGGFALRRLRRVLLSKG